MLLNNEAGVLNEKQIKYINEIHNGNQRMIKLINSFLSVSQLQLGTIQIRPIEIDLIKGIDDVLGEFQVSVDFKKIKIIKKYDTTTEFIFKTDPNLFRIIIQNLVSNAISYTSNSGEISIKIEKRQPDNLHIEVSDNGCGIPEEAKPKIFSEFFRAENAKLIKGDGSGLGLYITKSITELFGGKISFESKEGYGTTFILEIPGRSIISK
jgi:signal transduction histidine kinase